jgi:hypothetical protein
LKKGNWLGDVIGGAGDGGDVFDEGGIIMSVDNVKVKKSGGHIFEAGAVSWAGSDDSLKCVVTSASAVKGVVKGRNLIFSICGSGPFCFCVALKKEGLGDPV